ncbi:MAG TPA: hypothetical protein VGM18_05300 [Candidatus Sulfotelmatobacter sp.]|jgi:hypothetical protein
MSTIEGSLDIFWENNAQRTATPRYMLVFARYQNFKSGAQPAKHLVGADALESYLAEIGFDATDAKDWVKQLQAAGSVSIPHIWMPEEQMAAYEQSGPVAVKLDMAS